MCVAIDNMLIYLKRPGHTMRTSAWVGYLVFHTFPHTCVFFVHTEAGANLTLGVDETKDGPAQTGISQKRLTRRTQQRLLYFNMKSKVLCTIRF